MSCSRRELTAGLGALLWAPAARAFGDAGKFIPAVAQHAGRWDTRASGLRRMAWELQRRTSVEPVLETRAFRLDDPAIFAHPFLYFGGEGSFGALTDSELEHLRRYLNFGGFVFAEANDTSDGSGFDASFRREMTRAFPQSPLAPVPSTHVVFKSFFLLDAPFGRVLTRPHFDAVFLGGRAAVLYSQNDVIGALQRSEAGGFEFDVTPGGERQREYAARMAINIGMYALCLDYKDDAVHLERILKKRR